MFSNSCSVNVDCVSWYTETKFMTSTQRIYSRTHQEISPLCNSILGWVQKIFEHGAVKIQSWPSKPSMTSEDECRITNHFDRHPRTSLRIAEFCLGLPASSIQWVLRNRFHIFPFRLHIFQKLKQRDYDALVELFTWCVENIKLNTMFLNHVFFLWMRFSRGWQCEQTQRKDLGI